jgi:hypothetical protein
MLWPETIPKGLAVWREALSALSDHVVSVVLEHVWCCSVSAVDAVASSASVEPETIPKGLAVWREAVAKSQTAAQLSMAVHMLEASIAWDKSIMKAVSPSFTPSVGIPVRMAYLSL